jgi:hypothetical protein
LGVLREASHLSKEKSLAKKSQRRIVGLINGCRQRRVKWNKENKIIIGTWKKKCKPMLRGPLGRPKNRWQDEIRNDVKKLKIKNWTNCIQDRKDWKLYVEKAETLIELKL